MSALRSTPDQGGESAPHKELDLDMLAQIAHAFDFPDLNRFLNVCHCCYSINQILKKNNYINCMPACI